MNYITGDSLEIADELILFAKKYGLNQEEMLSLYWGNSWYFNKIIQDRENSIEPKKYKYNYYKKVK